VEIFTDGCSLSEIIWAMAILVEDAIAGTMILGTYTPNIRAVFQVLPNF
jgi:hypothetical protein